MFENKVRKDAIHPTPIFELLGLALEEFVDSRLDLIILVPQGAPPCILECGTTEDKAGMDPLELQRLEAPMEAWWHARYFVHCFHGAVASHKEIAVKNMVYRGLDKDGNAGVVFERMAQVLLRCRRLADRTCNSLVKFFGAEFKARHRKALT